MKHRGGSCATALIAGAFVAALSSSVVEAQAPGRIASEGLDREARALYEAATIAFEEARYESAAESFARAYALTGRPELLFNQASCAERLRRDREAIDFYRRYLEAIPDASNRDYVERRVHTLEATIAASDRAAEPTPVEVVPSPSTVQPAGPTGLGPVRDPDDASFAGSRVDSDDEVDTPIVRRWWFWTILGAVTVAAVAVPVGMARASGPDYEPYASGSTGRTVFTLVSR